MFLIDMLKSLVLGIVEGITEWLPISSTGHLIIVNAIIGNNGFTSSDLYLYVIQLGAILAIITLFFNKLNPFSPKKNAAEKKQTWEMWFKVIIGVIPAAVVGLLLEDLMERIENEGVVSAMLILYGIAFMYIERRKRTPSVRTMSQLTYKTALHIGLFQVLAVVPGTSRSGATILGALIIGCSRAVAAEYSFFLAIPIMFGISFIKIIKNLDQLASLQNVVVLLFGMAVSYVVSLFAVRFLMNYVKKHDFFAFGVYRIALGVAVILFVGIRALVLG